MTTTKLIAKSIHAMEFAAILRCMRTAIISPPPVLPPIWKARAVDVPIQIPAASAAKIFSPWLVNSMVKAGNRVSKIKSQSVCKAICVAVRNANFFFTKKNASTMSGKFKPKTIQLCWTSPFVATFNKIPIPLTPPIVNPLGVISVFAAKDIKKEETSK